MKQQIALCLGILAYLGSAVSARADYIFNFNKASSGPSLTTINADQSTNIAIYMDAIIGCSGCVTVSNGVAVAQEYNADGNVVGPTGTSLTLGNSENAANNGVTPSAYGSDNYISNMATNANGTGDDQLSQGITITLSKGYSFTGTFSFDYEIFPDISCTQSEFHPLRHAPLLDWQVCRSAGPGFLGQRQTPPEHHILGHNAIIHGSRW